MARPNTADSNRYLDSNNRLSSAGAAQSLKYARPQDLPSYPTSGLPSNRQKQDATTAANLGWQNQKSYEPWKPETSGAAATAATRGWNTTAPKQWQPEQSMSGARAAVLAAQRNKNLPAQGVTAPPPPQPRPAPSAWGNTAANLAVSNSKAKRPGTATPPGNKFRSSEIDRHGSLMAATGAMANGPRRRADSSPAVRPSYPDQANARTNALRAATAAQTNSQSPKAVPQGGANPAVVMPRGKFGYNPGSQPVVDADDKTHQDALQSSAIAMAQQMYKIMEKNKNDKEATAGASGAMGRNRSLSLSSGSEAAQPMRFNNIHDQAQVLAARRLADMHDEEAQSREWREYYAGQLGQPPGQSQQNTNRFSLGKMFSRNRRNSDDSMDDDVETRKIRAQMAVFQSSLSKVDTSKRQSDRDHLLMIAQRNVQKDLRDIDQKVYSKTGKATPQMQQQWEREAYERQQAEMYAQQQHEERMQTFGQIDIGGGTYMQQEQIDELARRNVQPVLDDIEVHNKERIDSEENAKLDAEERKRQAVVDKQREKESRELEKNIKQQMKEEAKAKKEEEKLSRKKSQKGSRLSRFGSISRRADANQPAAASASSPESSHVVQDAPPVLAPVPPTQPLSLSGQADGAEDTDIHHMSGAVRTSTTDTERATRESMGYVSAAGDPSPAVVAPVAPIAPEPAAVPLPRHDSDVPLAEQANAEMRGEIPVSETEYDPYLNHTAVPTSMSIKPEEMTAPVVVPFQSDVDKTSAPVVPTGVPATTAPVVPAQNTTLYETLPAATPPAKVLQKPLNTAPGTNKTSSPLPAAIPTEGSPKEKKGVKGWLKMAFRRGSSSGDNDTKLDRKASKRMSKISKEDPKGKKPMIGSPTPDVGADGTPKETTNIGLGKEDMGSGNLAQKAATQPGSSSGAVATSGPQDSHPDVHAVDRTLYDATPPGPATGAPGGQRQSMIDYERDQERARDHDEIAISDIDSELNARTHGKDPEQDASTVSMLSEGSMERKRIQELEYEQKEAALASSHLPKVTSETEMERAAEREEARDEVESLGGPKFPSQGVREGSPARETRFRENV